MRPKPAPLPPPEQDYQPGEAAQAASGYRFEEAEAPKRSQPSDTFENLAEQSPPPPANGFSRIAAGIIGAVVALAGAGGLQYAGLLGSPSGSGGNSAASADIEALRQEVAAIKDSGGTGDIAARVDDLTSGLDAVKADVAALKESLSAGAGGEAAGLQTLDTRIKAIKSSIANLGQGGTADAAGLSDLGERIAAVEALVKSTSDTATSTESKLAALEQSVGELEVARRMRRRSNRRSRWRSPRLH